MRAVDLRAATIALSRRMPTHSRTFPRVSLRRFRRWVQAVHNDVTVFASSAQETAVTAYSREIHRIASAAVRGQDGQRRFSEVVEHAQFTVPTTAAGDEGVTSNADSTHTCVWQSQLSRQHTGALTRKARNRGTKFPKSYTQQLSDAGTIKRQLCFAATSLV